MFSLPFTLYVPSEFEGHPANHSVSVGFVSRSCVVSGFPMFQKISHAFGRSERVQIANDVTFQWHFVVKFDWSYNWQCTIPTCGGIEESTTTSWHDVLCCCATSNMLCLECLHWHRFLLERGAKPAACQCMFFLANPVFFRAPEEAPCHCENRLIWRLPLRGDTPQKKFCGWANLEFSKNR